MSNYVLRRLPAVSIALGCLVPGLLWVTATPATPSPAVVAPAAAGSPNVVLITTDDQTVRDLRYMRHVQERLVTTGATFRGSASPYPLCCPARASMLTGQYAHNHGVLGNELPWGGFERFDDSSTLATWLSDAGYTTGFVGKYLNRYGEQDPTYVPPGWTEWKATLTPTVYQYRDFTVNEDGVLRDYTDDYQTDRLGQLAVDFVDRQAPADSPFFLWMSHVAPHGGGPLEPDDPAALGFSPGNSSPAVPERYRDHFADEVMPRPPGFNELDVSDKPGYVQARHLFRADDIKTLEETYQQRLEALLAVDDSVDSLLDALERSGELADTLVIFTSDNGVLQGAHRLRTKLFPYTQSVNVPLVISGPGIPAGVVRRQPSATIDLAPTIADATGVEPSLVVDGRSLLPLAVDASEGARRTIVLEAGDPGTYPTMAYTGIQTRRWMYIENDTGEIELYDRVKDPWQLQSLHADPTYDVLRGSLAARLAAFRDCVGAECRVVTLPPPAEDPPPGQTRRLSR